jgi:hypothetical protein
MVANITQPEYGRSKYAAVGEKRRIRSMRKIKLIIRSIA